VAALPMVALTAYVMREHIAAIDAAGADGVIAKPIVSIEQFGADILRFMRRRTALGGGQLGGGVLGGAAHEAQTTGTPAGSACDPAPIDFTVYDALAEMVGPAAMTELLGKVEADLRSASERLEQAVSGPDLGEARAVSHVLISVAGTIGAVKAQELARGLNQAAHDGDAEAVRRNAPVLVAETGRVVDFVHARSERQSA